MNRPAAESAAPASGGKFSVLTNRNFTLMWGGLIVSNSGSWMTLVGLGWLVYRLTDSPFALGVVGMARAIPMVIFPPMGGVIADRLPRLKLLKVTQALSFLLSLLLAALVQSDLIQVWQLVAFSFLTGLVNAFDQPTRQAILPDLVRREDLVKAIALQSSAWQGSALFGPTLAGLTIATVGVAGAFYFDALSFLAVVAALFAMRGVPEHSATRAPAKGFTTDLNAGLSYVRGTPLLFSLLLLATVAGVFGRSFQQFLPVFASSIYHEGSVGLGLMTSAPGLGSVVGAIVITMLADSKRKGILFLSAMFLFGLTLIVFSLQNSFIVGLVLLFGAGVFTLLFSSMLMTMIQLESAPEMRGRVMSLVTVTMQGFSPFGGLIVGAMAGPLGTQTAIAISAAVCAGAALFAFLAIPAIRNYASNPESGEPAQPWGAHGPSTSSAAAPGVASTSRPDVTPASATRPT